MQVMKLGCIDILWTKRKTIHRKCPGKGTKSGANLEMVDNKGFQVFL
jgi:hypothetical protein